MNNDFTELCRKVKEGIQEIMKFYDSVSWNDFSDRGTPWYKPYVFNTRTEREEYVLTHAAVEVELVKGSYQHIILGELVAEKLGNQYITYNWLCKAVSRLLSGTSIDDLHNMLVLSRRVQVGMKTKGLTKINTIGEALI